MAKPTIKSLQAEVTTLRELREYHAKAAATLGELNQRQVDSITALNSKIDDLQTQVRWHRQMNQNLVEKIPGARN